MSESESTELELKAHVALALVPGLGPKRTAALLDHFGSAAAALQATADELKNIPIIGEKLARELPHAFRTIDPATELALLAQHGVRPVVRGDPRYPPRLATIDDPPTLVYLRGEPTAADANAVAIVGSRSCTPYGLRQAARVAAGLASAGWTVVSGLARGIDAAAHRGALQAGGRTIAVLAGGLARIYPPEHADLAEQAAQQGYLLSETAMSVAPQPGMFPARNRIISALARGVVIVEAGLRSGALITAEHAAEQGREVFALPGPVESEASAGCLELIRKGARLVRSAEDILEDLQGIAPPDPPGTRSLFEIPALQPPPAAAMPPGLDEIDQAIWNTLDGTKHFDDLARGLGLSVADLTRRLMSLELKRAVRRLPGNFYDRR